MTSPLDGMGHGGYMFYDERYPYGDVYRCFQRAQHTAYTEFGVPSITTMEGLKKIIPSEELEEITDTPSWRLHHAVGAWMAQSHACMDILKMYFGEKATLEERIAQSDWLQAEGMKAIYEEARKQYPKCSAALSWCFNEPWITAANCSILRYPAIPKPGYYAVKDALRPTLFSARIPKFDWESGERFTAEIWLLNDGVDAVESGVEVLLEIGDQRISLLKWENACAEANPNVEGASVCCTLPAVDGAKAMKLILRAKQESMSHEYQLLYKRKMIIPAPKGMNM